MSFNWREEKLAKQYNRVNFDCGNADLNQFLQNMLANLRIEIPLKSMWRLIIILSKS